MDDAIQKKHPYAQGYERDRGHDEQENFLFAEPNYHFISHMSETPKGFESASTELSKSSVSKWHFTPEDDHCTGKIVRR